MNVIDENVIDNQRRQLLSWRIQVRQIGHELGNKGMKDDEIIPTKAKRMGKVIRASHVSLSFWDINREEENRVGWNN